MVEMRRLEPDHAELLGNVEHFRRAHAIVPPTRKTNDARVTQCHAASVRVFPSVRPTWQSMPFFPTMMQLLHRATLSSTHAHTVVI
jgi:hypothetical protein